MPFPHEDALKAESQYSASWMIDKAEGRSEAAPLERVDSIVARFRCLCSGVEASQSRRQQDKGDKEDWTLHSFVPLVEQ